MLGESDLHTIRGKAVSRRSTKESNDCQNNESKVVEHSSTNISFIGARIASKILFKSLQSIHLVSFSVGIASSIVIAGLSSVRNVFGTEHHVILFLALSVTESFPHFPSKSVLPQLSIIIFTVVSIILDGMNLVGQGSKSGTHFLSQRNLLTAIIASESVLLLHVMRYGIHMDLARKYLIRRLRLLGIPLKVPRRILREIRVRIIVLGLVHAVACLMHSILLVVSVVYFGYFGLFIGAKYGVSINGFLVLKLVTSSVVVFGVAIDTDIILCLAHFGMFNFARNYFTEYTRGRRKALGGWPHVFAFNETRYQILVGFKMLDIAVGVFGWLNINFLFSSSFPSANEHMKSFLSFVFITLAVTDVWCPILFVCVLWLVHMYNDALLRGTLPDSDDSELDEAGIRKSQKKRKTPILDVFGHLNKGILGGKFRVTRRRETEHNEEDQKEEEEEEEKGLLSGDRLSRMRIKNNIIDRTCGRKPNGSNNRYRVVSAELNEIDIESPRWHKDESENKSENNSDSENKSEDEIKIDLSRYENEGRERSRKNVSEEKGGKRWTDKMKAIEELNKTRNKKRKNKHCDSIRWSLWNKYGTGLITWHHGKGGMSEIGQANEWNPSAIATSGDVLVEHNVLREKRKGREDGKHEEEGIETKEGNEEKEEGNEEKEEKKRKGEIEEEKKKREENKEEEGEIEKAVFDAIMKSLVERKENKIDDDERRKRIETTERERMCLKVDEEKIKRDLEKMKYDGRDCFKRGIDIDRRVEGREKVVSERHRSDVMGVAIIEEREGEDVISSLRVSAGEVGRESEKVKGNGRRKERDEVKEKVGNEMKEGEMRDREKRMKDEVENRMREGEKVIREAEEKKEEERAIKIKSTTVENNDTNKKHTEMQRNNDEEKYEEYFPSSRKWSAFPSPMGMFSRTFGAFERDRETLLEKARVDLGSDSGIYFTTILFFYFVCRN